MFIRDSSRAHHRHQSMVDCRHAANMLRYFEAAGAETFGCCNGRESERSGILPTDESPTVTAQFRPFDPGIISDAIPAFFIGRNKEGFWVARDANGQIGGIFLHENSALSFAKRNSRPAGCATIFPSERFELDLENKGNPLVAHLGSLRRLALRLRQRMVGFFGKIAARFASRFPMLLL
jgi:hypothetical protein